MTEDSCIASKRRSATAYQSLPPLGSGYLQRKAIDKEENTDEIRMKLQRRSGTVKHGVALWQHESSPQLGKVQGPKAAEPNPNGEFGAFILPSEGLRHEGKHPSAA
ncbi:hypothetical protein MW887_007577 [Aspergillus wentii]|nr:hypothetical protein MW887_007577 [Aspergillus wentii]